MARRTPKRDSKGRFVKKHHVARKHTKKRAKRRR